MKHRQHIAAACLSLSLLALPGCSRRAAPPPPKVAPSETPTPSATEPAHEIAESTIRVADPQGRWTFEVQSERAEAAGIHGPYILSPAKGRYDEKGKQPVFMSADRTRVDEGARRVLFEGNVRIASAGWALEADRVDYNLNTGKVVASGRTKWTFSESASQLRNPDKGKEDEKAAGP